MTPRVGERGSAVVEMAVLGPLVIGLLVEVIVCFGVLHRATLATSAAAREYGRTITVASSEREAALRGAFVVRQVERNHGMDEGALHAAVTGPRRRGAVVEVVVSTSVPVIRLPFIGPVAPGVAIPVESRHRVRIDPFRSGGP